MSDKITFTHSGGHTMTYPADAPPDHIARVVGAVAEAIDGAASWQAEAEHWQDKYRSARDELKQARGELDLTRNTYQVDGDLLIDLITTAMPLIIANDAATDIAEEVAVNLARSGVTVLRGADHDPWPPDRDGRDTPICDEIQRHPKEVQRDALDGDQRVEYGVLAGSETIIADTTKGAAMLVAATIPDARACARTVTTGPWHPLPPVSDGNGTD